MVRSNDKFKIESKQPMTKIDGRRVITGSAEWQALAFKVNYYQFLEDKAKDPNAKNPLDLVDWKSYWPELYEILENWSMVDISNEDYLKKAKDYETYLENGGRVYKNHTHGSGYLDTESNEFLIDPYSIKDKEVHQHSVKG